MEARDYLRRLAAVTSYEDKKALMADMTAEENRCRELFAQKRNSWEVVGLEDPYLSLVYIHGEDPKFSKYQEQVLWHATRHLGSAVPTAACLVDGDVIACVDDECVGGTRRVRAGLYGGRSRTGRVGTVVDVEG